MDYPILTKKQEQHDFHVGVGRSEGFMWQSIDVYEGQELDTNVHIELDFTTWGGARKDLIKDIHELIQKYQI